MPEFAYEAVTTGGRSVRGLEDAGTVEALERQLAMRGLYAVRLAPSRGRTPARARFRSRRADAVEAIRYLATLLDAGFPLDRALGTAERAVGRRDVADALSDIRERVRAGQSLADGWLAHPRIFPRLAAGMTRAGERGGHLADALARLAQHLEREQALRAQLWSASIYPMIMAVAAAVAIGVLVLYVLPRFATLLVDAGAALPRSTALVLGAADWIARGWPWLVPVGAAIAIGLGALRRSATGSVAMHAFFLRWPVVGALRRRLVAARLGRSLSTLLASGLPIVPALEVSASALTDPAAARAVLAARDRVRSGARLAPSLARGDALPFVFVQMVQLGEEGGRLPEMLERAAAFAEDDLRRGLERLVRLVEPMMILVFGAIAGFVALALLQAIYGVRVGP